MYNRPRYGVRGNIQLYIFHTDCMDSFRLHAAAVGKLARYMGRHGSKHVAMAVLIGAVPPSMLKTEANPGACPSKPLTRFAPVF